MHNAWNRKDRFLNTKFHVVSGFVQICVENRVIFNLPCGENEQGCLFQVHDDCSLSAWIFYSNTCSTVNH